MKMNPINSALKYLRLSMRDAELDAVEKFNLEMNSLGEIAVRGCKDISSYTEEEIMLVAEEYYLVVKGNTLQIKQYLSSLTVISGNAESINFIKR